MPSRFTANISQNIPSRIISKLRTTGAFTIQLTVFLKLQHNAHGFNIQNSLSIIFRAQEYILEIRLFIFSILLDCGLIKLAFSVNYLALLKLCRQNLTNCCHIQRTNKTPWDNARILIGQMVSCLKQVTFISSSCCVAFSSFAGVWSPLKSQPSFAYLTDIKPIIKNISYFFRVLLNLQFSFVFSINL